MGGECSVETASGFLPASATRGGGRVCRWVLCFALLTVCFPFPAVASDRDAERDLWTIWKSMDGATNGQPDVVKACGEFEKQHSPSDLVYVAQTIAAWNLLKLGRMEEARSLLEKNLVPRAGEASKAAREMSRAWLTRIDIAGLEQLLKIYYRREIEYPPVLARLVDYKYLPENATVVTKDRWGMSLDYRLVNLRMLKTLRNQAYKVTSHKLKDQSDLAGALAMPYGSSINVQLGRVVRRQSGDLFLEVREAPVPAADGSSPPVSPPALLRVGAAFNGVMVAYIGSYIVVVGDVNHWKVFPKPQ